MLLIKQNSHISNLQLKNTLMALHDYIHEIGKLNNSHSYNKKESFINLPFDENNLKQCLKLKEKLITQPLKYLVLIGIGGSDLGAKAIYDAIYGYYDQLEPERFPKVIFIETTNTRQLEKIHSLLKAHKNPNEILINVISKSGKTLETVANMEILLQEISWAKERTVITTIKSSDLHKKAEELEIPTLELPDEISGRFSVFSNVGIFPLAVVGVDVIGFMEGGMQASKDCLLADVQNPALQSAAFIKTFYDAGKVVHNLFVFEPELESLGSWYEQLLSESLGKDNKGITPLTSVGSRDLHSEMQLDLAGPKDKIFTFVWTDKRFSNMKLNNNLQVGVREEIRNKEIGDIEKTILKAAKDSYEKNGIQTLAIKLEDISAKELGYFMQYKMLEVAYLGKLMDLNAFEQPAVEEYKKESRRILAAK